MSQTLQCKIINDIKCYSPDVAENYDDYPDEGFDVTDQLEAESFWARARIRLIKIIIARYSPLPAKTNFLDVGCGTGAVIQGIMGNANFKITGAEIYLGGLLYAKKKLLGAEFRNRVEFPKILNLIFDKIMRIDETFIRLGVSLLYGGSLVGVVPKNE